MSSKAMSLKARIRNLAAEQHISAQVVLQNYMFERLLERISISPYRDHFVLKGGLLIAAMVGLDTRSTMDMDVTLKTFPLSEEQIENLLAQICAVQLDDDTSFHFLYLEPIRKDDIYGGFRVHLEARYDTLIAPLSMDISTGDVITPRPSLYSFKAVFDSEKEIELWAYNVETVLAEKVETILRRGVFNTRPRDFYDVYILYQTQSFDKGLFLQALLATAKHRGTSEQIANVPKILETIAADAELKATWKRYQQEYDYAQDIDFLDTVTALSDLVKGC